MNLIKVFWKMYYIDVLYVLFMALLVVTFPPQRKSYATLLVVFILLYIVYLYARGRVYNNMLSFKSYLVKVGIFFVGFSILYFAFKFAGGYGILAVFGLLFLIAGYKLYRGRKLYMRTVRWGAERLKGRHREDFSLDDKEDRNVK